MSKSELDWVNSYHAEVWEKVSPRLQNLPEELSWLRAHTAPLNTSQNGSAASQVRVLAFRGAACRVRSTIYSYQLAGHRIVHGHAGIFMAAHSSVKLSISHQMYTILHQHVS